MVSVATGLTERKDAVALADAMKHSGLLKKVRIRKTGKGWDVVANGPDGGLVVLDSHVGLATWLRVRPGVRA